METGAVRNADEWFRLMVETGLAPGLRALGFSGSGRRFRMMTETHLATVSILQVKDPARRSIKFTLSLSVTAKDEWSDQLRIRPYLHASGTGKGWLGWEERIGDLISVGGLPIGDLWWKLDAGRPFVSLAGEVLTLLREFGIPAMTAQINRTPLN